MEKRLFALVALFFVLVSGSKAQISMTDNYSRIYGGYTNMGAFDAPSYSENDHGFLVGYTYGFNVTKSTMPLFVEIGAEYSMVMGGEKPLNETIHMISIPLSLTYKIGNDMVNVAPNAGLDLRYNVASSINGISISDSMSTIQGGWHAGANVNFKNVTIGYKFTGMFNELVEHSGMSNYSNSIILGFCF